ncbi:MAG TPA: orotate phosphoribosyltransferase [Phaeodactylibacter sp.]|nr:orotate phosphoribosyltransferase [Phaeodactylibacter sp.]
MATATELAGKLLQIKAIKLSPRQPFTWASGILSPIYCDNRLLLSHPALRDEVVRQLVKASERFAPFDAIAGVATAGIPHGVLLADRLHKPFLYVRSKAKAHGRQNLIEGQLPAAGSKILVVEDLISTGGSSLQAVEALRSAGMEVAGVLALFTYGFRQTEQRFADAQCPLYCLSNYDSLLQQALTENYISAEELKELNLWRQNINS